MPKEKLYDEVRKIKNLQSAWSQIYANGMSSLAKETNASVQEFKINEHDNLNRICRELCKGKFVFGGVKGIGVKKSKAKCNPRPIVMSPLPIRIVQRSILDVLQRKKQIRKFLQVSSSFGAIQGKGVPQAIQSTINAIKNGASYYIKSDIASFFTCIDRKKVIEVLSNTFPAEKRFIELLEKATNLEIQNLVELEKEHGAAFKQLFIYSEIGTPQGCCLSPLFGNILLYEFDTQMNYNDIVCLRYLDDFIILGPSLKAVKSAFRKAIKLLQPLGLSAYDPGRDQDKASQGTIANGFDYLGIEFKDKKIRPVKKVRDRLLQAVDEIVEESKLVNFSKAFDGTYEKKSFVATLNKIHKKVKGWGNQYFFCNDVALWGSLDSEIDIRIGKYVNHYFMNRRKLEKQKKRRQLGLHLLVDSKSEPIIWQA